MPRRSATQKAKTPKRTPRRKKLPWHTTGDPTRLLALDQSSVCVGWAYVEDGKLKDYGKFVQVGDEHGERLMNFMWWLEERLTTLNPTTVAIEAPFQGRHRNAFGVLSMYRGAIMASHFHALKRELEARNQIPAHLIKRVLEIPKGTHAENKEAAVHYVNNKHGLNLRYVAGDTGKRRSQDDIADAIAVADAWELLHE